MKDTDILRFSRNVDLPNQRQSFEFSIQFGKLTDEERRIINENDALMCRLANDPRATSEAEGV